MRAVGLAGFDHAGGVVEGGGERLLAGDALYAMVGAVDDDVGVGVVAGGDAEEVEVFLVYHLAVVGVGARLGKHVAPLLAEGVEKLTSQVADGDDLGVGQDGVGADVGVGHGGVQHRRGVVVGAAHAHAGQSDNAGAVGLAGDAGRSGDLEADGGGVVAAEMAQLQAKLAGGDGEAALDGARGFAAVEGEVNGGIEGTGPEELEVRGLGADFLGVVELWHRVFSLRGRLYQFAGQLGRQPHPLTSHSRTESARCGAAVAHRPAPSPSRSEREGVDSRFRGNDRRMGATCCAPTANPYLPQSAGPGSTWRRGGMLAGISRIMGERRAGWWWVRRWSVPGPNLRERIWR